MKGIRSETKDQPSALSGETILHYATGHSKEEEKQNQGKGKSDIEKMMDDVSDSEMFPVDGGDDDYQRSDATLKNHAPTNNNNNSNNTDKRKIEKEGRALKNEKTNEFSHIKGTTSADGKGAEKVTTGAVKNQADMPGPGSTSDTSPPGGESRDRRAKDAYTRGEKRQRDESPISKSSKKPKRGENSRPAARARARAGDDEEDDDELSSEGELMESNINDCEDDEGEEADFISGNSESELDKGESLGSEDTSESDASDVESEQRDIINAGIALVKQEASKLSPQAAFSDIYHMRVKMEISPRYRKKIISKVDSDGEKGIFSQDRVTRYCLHTLRVKSVKTLKAFSERLSALAGKHNHGKNAESFKSMEKVIMQLMNVVDFCPRQIDMPASVDSLDGKKCAKGDGVMVRYTYLTDNLTPSDERCIYVRKNHLSILESFIVVREFERLMIQKARLWMEEEGMEDVEKYQDGLSGAVRKCLKISDTETAWAFYESSRERLRTALKEEFEELKTSASMISGSTIFDEIKKKRKITGNR